MGTAKIISLQAKPSQTSLLCFEVDGILGGAKAQLGDSVAAFDFDAFYSTLNAAPTIAGDASRLQYDPDAIAAATAASTLATLRSEQRRIALTTAISARQNAYFSKYANISDVIAKLTTFYSPNVSNSKPKRLAALSDLANTQASTLKSAYTSDHRLGVVKQTKSTLTSTTHSNSYASTQEDATQSGASDQVSMSAEVDHHPLPKLPASGNIAGWKFKGGDDPTETMTEGTATASTVSSGDTITSGGQSETQQIANTDYGYRIPYVESEAQNQRAQISLIDQQFAQFMYSQPLPYLAQMFQNELTTIDNDVIRLQVSFLNCTLMSPFAGTVTGVYKNPGDVVRAGEPVMRVENNAVVYLVASVVYRSRIAIGSSVSVTTSLYDGSAGQTAISGTVVAARGRAPNDDQWDLVVLCKNVDGSGNEIVPLDYSFDFDDTVLTIN